MVLVALSSFRSFQLRFLHQVRPHPEVGAVPAGGPGHLPGHAEAALHEGAGAHRQVVRGVPAGAAVGGGGPQAAAAVVRPAAQQELHREHVTRGGQRLSEVSTAWERSGLPLKW